MIGLHQQEIDLPTVDRSFLDKSSASWAQTVTKSQHCLKNSHGFDEETQSEIGVRMDVGDCGNGFWDFIKISDDIFMTVTDVSYDQDLDILVQGEDLLKIRFVFEGAVHWYKYDLLQPENSGSSPSSYTMLSYHPRGIDSSYRMAPNCRQMMVTMHCKRAFIETLFSSAFFDLFAPNGVEVHSARPVGMTLPLNPKAKLCINEILCSPYTGYTRLTYMNAKAMEVLCIVAHEAEQIRTAQQLPVSNLVLSSRDIEKLAQMHDLIATDLQHWYTSKELCKKYGINSKKLKYGFKKVYALTPHKFALDVRMQKAYKLFKEDNLSVSEVAYSLGYDHAANFTTAFKRYFGYTPQHFRNQN